MKNLAMISRNGAIFFLFFLLILWECLDCPGQVIENDLLFVEIQSGDNKEATRLQIREGSTLILSYIHSLYRTPQEEVYTIVKATLHLTEVRFGNLEAGFYYDPNPPGGFQQEKGFWINKLPCPIQFAEIKIRIPCTGQLRLVVNGSNIWVARKEDCGGGLRVIVGFPSD